MKTGLESRGKQTRKLKIHDMETKIEANESDPKARGKTQENRNKNKRRNVRKTIWREDGKRGGNIGWKFETFSKEVEKLA